MPEESHTGDRIDSWKQIAVYLGRDQRTVIRWEKERNLPIHRTPGGQRQRVFAFRHELDAWLLSQKHGSSIPNGTDADNSSYADPAAPPSAEFTQPPQTVPRWTPVFFTAIFAVLLLLAAAAWRFADSEIAIHTPQVIGQQQLTQNSAGKKGLLTDGFNLYFGQEQNGRMALAKMPAAGGPVHILWSPSASVDPVDLSPDGSRILALLYQGYEHERELWDVPLDGGAPHRLGNISAHAAVWAPSGQRIVYATETRLYLANADGTGVREIGSFEAVPESLHWSADGKRLRFLLVDAVTEKQSSWELDSNDGMATTTLNSAPAPQESSEYEMWTPTTRSDGQFFVEQLDPAGDHAVSFLQHARVWWGPRIQTARLPLSLKVVNGIAVDPASQRMFLISGPQPSSASVQVDPHTGEFREILSGISGIYLDYSRDGRRLAYVSSQDDGTLWISNVDGSNAQQLTTRPEAVQLPRWSPDGKHLAYIARWGNNGPWRIYIRRMDTGEVRAAAPGDDNQGAPTWSPDGKYLVYGNMKCQPTHACSIHRIDLATGAVETLPGSEGLFTARLSPDGRSIAAIQPERHEAMLFDMATRRWRKLADHVNGTDMNWSPDSKYVYTDTPGTDARILRIRAADGHEETAADLHSQDLFSLAEADDLGFTIAPDGSVILHHHTSALEIYAYDLR